MRGRCQYILGSKAKVTTELCRHFGPNTITGVVFNVKLSCFIHRCRVWLEEDTYRLWGQKVTTELSQHFGSDMITLKVVFNVRISL